MDMEKLRQLAVIGDEHLCGNIRGVALVFHGLGCTAFREFSEFEIQWAHNGWLLVFPYYGPWTWLNRNARALVDEIVDSVYRHYRLDDHVPLIATGGSLGGYSALLYPLYARRPVQACVARCPVTDMEYSFHERDDVPRTVYHAFAGEERSLETLFNEHSPLRRMEEMPDIPYLVVHGFNDVMVSKAAHSDPFVAGMRNLGRRVEYLEVEGYGHGGPLPGKISRRMVEFVRDMDLGQ